jgi:general secretion pathway protein C
LKSIKWCADDFSSVCGASMKRLPVVVSFLLFLVLCASLAYWALPLFSPAPRAISAPPRVALKSPPVSAAANLFGGAANTATAMPRVLLRGIIHAGLTADSVAILAADGSPPKSLQVDDEVMPGVTVKAIHARHVVLSDHGVTRELSLPEFATASAGAISAPVAARGNAEPATMMNQAQTNQTFSPQPSGPPVNNGMNAAGGAGAGQMSAPTNPSMPPSR